MKTIVEVLRDAIPPCPVCDGLRYALGDPPKFYCQTCIVRHVQVRREAGLSPFRRDRAPYTGGKKKLPA